MFKSVRLILLVATVYSLIACAGFSGNKIEKVKGEIFQNDRRLSVYYQLVVKDNLGFKSRKKFENTQLGEFVRAVRDTQCCHVTTDHSVSDISIELTITKYENPAALLPALFTRLTLYVMPSWATTRYTFTANVTDSHNNEYSYSLSDDWTIVQWWPAIVLYPFYTPEKVDELVLRNLNKALLARIHRDGVI